MDSVNYLKFLAALLFVLALLWGCAWVARRFGFMPQGAVVRRGQPKRLEILEVLTIDARRRFILMRRDDVEHLVLIGEGETVVERSIQPPEPSVMNDSAPEQNP